MAFTREQLHNAGIIYSVGRGMGMTTRDIQIGIIAALVESNLVNVNYGDRDSLGLFQQRPSQGWGTPAQVTDPYYASRKFFSALRDLGDRRYGMGMGEAAQAVQRSAFPSRYGERIPQMRSLWPKIAEAGGDKQFDLDGNPYGQNQAFTNNVPPTTFNPLAELDVTQVMDTPDPLSMTATPDASAYLGAWGMSADLAPDYDPEDDATMSFLSPGTNTIIQQIREETSFGKGVNGWRAAVLNAAQSAVGTPYAWGGNSLAGGVDCSGLVQQAFARAGLDLPRVSYQQANFGRRTSIKSLRPGDLVAWDNSSRNNGADHIAIYLGGGRIIEAARPGTVVRIRSLGSNEGAWGVSMNF